MSSSARSSASTLPVIFSRRAARVVVACDLEIAVQQIDHRQVRRRLAVRDREGLQHHPAGLRRRLELEEQPRLADARPRPSPRRSARARLAPARRAASSPPSRARARRTSSARARAARCKPRAQRPEPGHLVNVDRLADAFDSRRARARLKHEVAFAQLAGRFGHRDRTDRREQSASARPGWSVCPIGVYSA